MLLLLLVLFGSEFFALMRRIQETGFSLFGEKLERREMETNLSIFIDLQI
jgi:hypothetical protein